MNILLAAILITNLTILAGLAVAFVKISGIYRQFMEFITPQAENQPSALADTISKVSDMVARSLVAQVKSTFMGIQSGDVRGSKAIDADMAIDAVSQVNPAIGAVLSQFPALKKTLRRNPALLDLALNKLTQKTNTTAVIAQPSGSNGHDKVRFNF